MSRPSETARHVVLATPLAGYAERACELIYQSRTLNDLTTFWLIPSVQAGVWRAVSATLELVANPRLSAVFLHPMYGPNGFRETEPEARTFQNVLTATYAGANHPLDDELTEILNLFLTRFNIRTTAAFNPDEHDRITAYSQGLSYCVARLMFERPDLDQILREEMSDLHHSFSGNRDSNSRLCENQLVHAASDCGIFGCVAANQPVELQRRLECICSCGCGPQPRR